MGDQLDKAVLFPHTPGTPGSGERIRAHTVGNISLFNLFFGQPDTGYLRPGVHHRGDGIVIHFTGEPGNGRIIAEARFVKDKWEPRADVAFVVDEEYQGLGIASYIYRKLIRLAKEKGLQGFTADVLASNKGMMKVFEKGGLPIQAKLEDGVYELSISF